MIKVEANITHIDSDDWHWYFVDGELAYEGSEQAANLLAAILKGLSSGPSLDISFSYACIDDELAEQANYEVDTLEEFVALGLDLGELE